MFWMNILYLYANIKMKNWSAVDIIILILVTIISLVLLLSVLLPFISGMPASDSTAKLIAGLIASIISIISMYVGAKIQKNKK
jgi:hypothetical protein